MAKMIGNLINLKKKREFCCNSLMLLRIDVEIKLKRTENEAIWFTATLV